GSPLGGHPDWKKVPGVEASTGSLGHGLPLAVGVAMGLRIRGIDRRVFTLVGDGECNEGSIWEASMLAAHHHLTNLTCIVDYNHSTDRALALGDIGEKFAAFGWKTVYVDGHDHDEIFAALREPDAMRPLAVVAETIKGRGYQPMENNPAWHHAAVRPEDLERVFNELT